MNGVKEAKGSKLIAAAGLIIIAGALHIAREIFIPIAVAILFSFLLTPLVNRLTKFHIPNALAVITTVGVAFTVIGVIAWLVTAQFINLLDDLPKYQENIRAKIVALKAPRDSVFSRAGESIDALKKEIKKASEDTAEAPTEPNPSPKPIPVQVEQPPSTPLQLLSQYAAPFLGPLGTASISVILVVFILLQRNDLRDRLIKLISGGDLNLATQAVDDATQRITRYLLMQAIINVSYGVPLGIGLYFIGVPNALLWGLLATLLRFIPYVGPWIAAVFPLSLAFAVDPGWTMPLLTLALVVAMELFSNNFIEPWLYGTSTGISAVALIFAALVWTWIWGPVGLFLSTPLTVCLLVIGKNVPSLSFLSVILGTEPVLAPEARLYQRMLAMDSESMLNLADSYLKTDSLLNFYDRVLIPALTMSERDRHAGTLAEHRQQFIITSTRDLIEDLEDRYAPQAPLLPSRGTVVCLPAKDEADELAAFIFAQLLRQSGISSKVLSLDQPLPELASSTPAIPSLFCICAIPPGAVSGTRRRCRQLRAAGIHAQVLAGIWGTQESATAIQKQLATPCPDLVATTFPDAIVQVAQLLAPPLECPMVPAPIPSTEPERLQEVRKLGLLDTPPEELYDAVTRKLAQTFEVPISLVSIIDADRQFWKSQTGLPEDLAQARGGPRATSLCGHVVAQNELLVFEDLSQDERFAGNPFVKDRGIRFYAGAPLRTKSGHAVGSLCVLDTKPRKITDEQKWLLSLLASHLMQAAEERPTTSSPNEPRVSLNDLPEPQLSASVT